MTKNDLRQATRTDLTERQVAARRPNAAQVSHALKVAGHVRASEYQPFGREVDGFAVHKSSIGPKVTVFTTYPGDRGQELLDAYAATLTEAGYTVRPAGRRVGSHLGLLEVVEPS